MPCFHRSASARIGLVIGPMTQSFPPATIGYGFSHAHLLGIDPLKPGEIAYLLDRAAYFAELEPGEAPDALAGSTVINLFFENSTRTRSSFEIAAPRLGAAEAPTLPSPLSLRRYLWRGSPLGRDGPRG